MRLSWRAERGALAGAAPSMCAPALGAWLEPTQLVLNMCARDCSAQRMQAGFDTQCNLDEAHARAWGGLNICKLLPARPESVPGKAFA